MKPALPWRTLVPSRETGRFTAEQLDAAVLTVMDRARYTYTPSRPLYVRERGPGWGSPRPVEPAAAEGAAQEGQDAAITASRKSRDGRAPGKRRPPRPSGEGR